MRDASDEEILQTYQKNLILDVGTQDKAVLAIWRQRTSDGLPETGMSMIVILSQSFAEDAPTQQ